MIKKFQTPSGRLTYPGQLFLQTSGYVAPEWYDLNKMRKLEEEVKKKTGDYRRRQFASLPKPEIKQARLDNTRVNPSDKTKVVRNFQSRRNNTSSRGYNEQGNFYARNGLNNTWYDNEGRHTSGYDNKGRYYETSESDPIIPSGLYSTSETTGKYKPAEASIAGGLSRGLDVITQAIPGAVGSIVGYATGTKPSNDPFLKINKDDFNEYGAESFQNAFYRNSGITNPVENEKINPLGRIGIALGQTMLPYFVPYYGGALAMLDVYKAATDKNTEGLEKAGDVAANAVFLGPNAISWSKKAPAVAKLVTAHPRVKRLMQWQLPLAAGLYFIGKPFVQAQKQAEVEEQDYLLRNKELNDSINIMKQKLIEQGVNPAEINKILNQEYEY